MKRYRLSAPAAVLAGALVTIAAMAWFSSPMMVCPGIAFTAMLLLGSDLVLERMQKWIDARRARIVAIPVGLWLLYLIYAAGMHIETATGATMMAVYLSVPFVALGVWPKVEPLVIFWIWLPLELGIIRQVLIMRAAGVDLHYAFAIQFIHCSFALRKLYTAVPVFAGIFLFTALPEEFLFRGLIQNWIERVTDRRALGLLIASVIFGVSHLNNGPPIPNYRYFLMATIAGIFYGRAWRNTGSLMASSLTHALVDTVWSVVFR